MNKVFDEYLDIDYSEMRTDNFLSRMNTSNIASIQRVQNGKGFKDVKTCNFCEGKNQSLYLTKNEIEILKCNDCDLVFSSVIPKDFNDVYSNEDYLASTIEMYEKNSEFRKKRFGTERLKIIKGYKKKGSLLDIGCGIGWFLEVAMSNFDVKGVEISDSLRGYLKKNKDIDSFKYIDDIPDNSADVITGFDLIEHVEDPSSLLKSIYRILKPQGICLLFTPNVNSIGFKLLKQKSSLLCPPEHLYYFSEETISKYAEKAEFNILKVWTRGIDIGDVYAEQLSLNNLALADFLNENQNWIQHSIDEAGFGNHMRVLLEKI
ncbi:MAG: class I SAM-dependent methyltransferase [Gammaproteobacteria bacterium]|nr:class I SAM-dependent methyltransferase [Gammaproteobacteria bacterium]